MYHTVIFVENWHADVERSANKPLERVLYRRGTRQRVQLGPRIVETKGGPVETADLYFEDGTVTRAVPYACFAFAD